MKSKRLNNKRVCGFCGLRFKSQKTRTKHAKDCREVRK